MYSCSYCIIKTSKYNNPCLKWWDFTTNFYVLPLLKYPPRPSSPKKIAPIFGYIKSRIFILEYGKLQKAKFGLYIQEFGRCQVFLILKYGITLLYKNLLWLKHIYKLYFDSIFFLKMTFLQKIFFQIITVLKS